MRHRRRNNHCRRSRFAGSTLQMAAEFSANGSAAEAKTFKLWHARQRPSCKPKPFPQRDPFTHTRIPQLTSEQRVC